MKGTARMLVWLEWSGQGRELWGIRSERLSEGGLGRVLKAMRRPLNIALRRKSTRGSWQRVT